MLKTLTKSQRQTLELLCHDKSYSDVAHALGRGTLPSYVEEQVSHIFSKLGIASTPRDQLLRYGEDIKFLEAHAKPPSGMTSREIEEIRHAPDGSDNLPAPRWAVSLARQYGQELERRRNLPAVVALPEKPTATTSPSKNVSPLPTSVVVTPAAAPTQNKLLIPLVASLVVAALAVGWVAATMMKTPPSPPAVSAPPVAQTEPTRAVVQVAPPTAVPAATTPPTAAPTKPSLPTATPLPPATSTPAAINMLGRAASDPPGTDIKLGSTVTSIVDVNSKRDDFYVVDVQAGDDVQVLLKSDTNAAVEVTPLKKIDCGTCWVISSNTDRPGKFTAAISEKYVVRVRARGNGVRYSLSITKL